MARQPRIHMMPLTLTKIGRLEPAAASARAIEGKAPIPPREGESHNNQARGNPPPMPRHRCERRPAGDDARQHLSLAEAIAQPPIGSQKSP